VARRKRLPTLFLMTDPRLGDALWEAIDRLPRGAGIVVRHHEWPRTARARLVRQVKARSRGRHVILVAAPSPGARADGVHLPAWARPVFKKRELLTAAVHNRRELERAKRLGVDMIFVSPVFPTASHPGARTLGPLGFSWLARAARVPVIALGGMNEARFRRVAPLGATGWAAISALAR
jgi:thiamine-phosphate pyrophosphorylase